MEPTESGQVRENNHNKTFNAVRTLNSETRFVTTLFKYTVCTNRRVWQKGLRMTCF